MLVSIVVELEHALQDSEAKMVVTIPQLLPVVKQAQLTCPQLKASISKANMLYLVVTYIVVTHMVACATVLSLLFH